MFWMGRRVFLTGHTGFKGGWLALWLQHLGAEVTGYALAPGTEPSLFELARVSEGMHSLIGDVRDADGLAAALAESRAEVVFHLAAQPLVRYSYANPLETYATNVMGTANLLDAVRRTPGVRAVVIVTSDKCYANREQIWGYREDDPMGGHDPYSSSKGCAELVTAAFRDSYFPPGRYAEHGVALASARAGNVIGGGDWSADRLVPDILRAFGEGQPVQIRSPRAVRPWQHVIEPLGGYLHLAERLYTGGVAFAEGWNFGPQPEDARPVAWVLDYMVRAWGARASWAHDGGQHPHEAGLLTLDCTKAHSQLGWTPRLRLGEALDWTITWYREYLNGHDVRMITEQQIAHYMARLADNS
ncbi:CDP-glucose 4,6-dehydratase [Chloroflexales bacterium ZM16-3]|nr:CDP-glucose 4,6-dehydratase [Chloroflexales bacterium ZM16-3]